MKLNVNFKSVVSALAEWDVRWAVCGGMAAGVYRKEPRFTADIDIALVDTPKAKAREIAESIITKFGLEPKIGFIESKSGALLPGAALVSVKDEIEGSYFGFDFLLPLLPWVTLAVERAQSNLLDFGFGKIPTISPEDLIIAKLFAHQTAPGRPYDLDDILSILGNNSDLDFGYLKTQITRLALPVPDQVGALLPGTF